VRTGGRCGAVCERYESLRRRRDRAVTLSRLMRELSTERISTIDSADLCCDSCLGMVDGFSVLICKFTRGASPGRGS
jgi:hypothetical protein